MTGITIRPPRRDELAFVRWLWSDAETMRPVGGTIVISEDEVRAWFARMVDPGGPRDRYRLIVDGDDRPVGEIGFHRLDPETMTATLNVKIASRERGRGYARAALVRLLDYYFNTFGGRVLIDDLRLDNRRGRDVLVRFGFERVGEMGDAYRLRMTRERFNALYGLGGEGGGEETRVAGGAGEHHDGAGGDASRD
jgi:RimJ/RimL family protein N-acetyltransferase